MVAIQLASRAAQHGPVFLTPKSLRVTIVHPGVVFKLVVCLFHERWNVIWCIVFMEDLRVSWIVSIGSCQCRIRHQQRIIERAAHEVVEFSGLEMVRVSRCDPPHNGCDQTVVGWAGVPSLEVVSRDPNDVVEVFIVASQEFSVLQCLSSSILFQDRHPARCLESVHHNLNAVISCQPDHLIQPPEIGRVRRGHVSRRGERDDAVIGASIRAPGGVGIT